jgi:glycerol-3-phosphate dehydrogenase (NAD(P)+)
MVIDGYDREYVKTLVDALKSPLIRFYYGDDIIGSEIGAAAKNVIGIAAGVLDGVGLPSLKGPLMARGAREVARLISAMGGNELSAYGLCHLGDYETTLFSPHSNNRRFGELLATGKIFDKLAEGVYTAKALKLLGNGKIHFIGSDTHNMTSRAPKLDVAYGQIHRKFGEDFVFQMNEFGKSALGHNI